MNQEPASSGVDKAKAAAKTTQRWAHVASFAIAGLMLLFPNEVFDASPLLGLGLVGYAGWIAAGRRYLWLQIFYLFPVVAVLLVFT